MSNDWLIKNTIWNILSDGPMAPYSLCQETHEILKDPMIFDEIRMAAWNLYEDYETFLNDDLEFSLYE